MLKSGRDWPRSSRAMRTATINNLYTNPLVYRYFGFEGSSVEYGGYITAASTTSAGCRIRDRRINL